MSAVLMGPVAQVERATREHPDAIALTSPDGHLSYEQLWLRALALAERLIEVGVGPGDPVALCLPRSIELIVGALGVLAAGGCYVAMDPDYPDERLRFMMDDSGARVVVAKADAAARIRASHTVEPMQSAVSALAAPVAVGAGDPAYIVYTSGSTGRPKGVIIEHAGLGNLVDWHEKTFGITESDRTALISSPGFDAAVWEIWPCLAAGASLHVPPAEARTDPIALRDWLLSERITTTFVPTPLCEAVIALDWPDTAPLRVMLTGGDVLHRRPRAGLPFQLVNNYGVSEATVVSTSGTVTPADAAGGCADLPTLGSAISGVTLTVVDPDGRPVPPDTAGELVIGGVSVGRVTWAIQTSIGLSSRSTRRAAAITAQAIWCACAPTASWFTWVDSMSRCRSGGCGLNSVRSSQCLTSTRRSAPARSSPSATMATGGSVPMSSPHRGVSLRPQSCATIC